MDKIELIQMFLKQKGLTWNKEIYDGDDIKPAKETDFNKNNLIDHIPEPTIIYKDTRLTVYGAGPLL